MAMIDGGEDWWTLGSATSNGAAHMTMYPRVNACIDVENPPFLADFPGESLERSGVFHIYVSLP